MRPGDGKEGGGKGVSEGQWTAGLDFGLQDGCADLGRDPGRVPCRVKGQHHCPSRQLPLYTVQTAPAAVQGEA